MPPLVEVKVLDFLGCLSAQQLFVLKILSAMGVHNLSTTMLEELYPIPVAPGTTLVGDVMALDAAQVGVAAGSRARLCDLCARGCAMSLVHCAWDRACCRYGT
jgi:hypothetical protein